MSVVFSKENNQQISVANPINLWLPGCTGTQFFSCSLTNGGLGVGVGQLYLYQVYVQLTKMFAARKSGESAPSPLMLHACCNCQYLLIWFPSCNNNTIWLDSDPTTQMPGSETNTNLSGKGLVFFKLFNRPHVCNRHSTVQNSIGTLTTLPSYNHCMVTIENSHSSCIQ